MSEVEGFTKTQIRTEEKAREESAQKKKSRVRKEAQIERDKNLHLVAEHYMPKIQDLQQEMRREQKQIWDKWKEQRSGNADS